MLTEMERAWVHDFVGMDPGEDAGGGPGDGQARVASAGDQPAPAPGAPRGDYATPGAPRGDYATPGAPGGGNAAPGQPAPPASDIATKINDTIAEFEAQSKRLKDAGLDSGTVDEEVKRLRTELDAATNAGSDKKQQAALNRIKREMAEDVTERLGSSLDPAKKDVNRQIDAATVKADDAIKELHGAAKTVIDKLQPGDVQKDLAKRWSDLDARLPVPVKVTDPAKQAAARKAADKEAQELLKQAGEQAGEDAKAAPAGADKKAAQKAANEARKEVQVAFKKALEQKFGIKINQDSGGFAFLNTPNTHFDKVYEMFEKVPLSHVVQEKMMDLSYVSDHQEGDTAIGEFKGGAVLLGDFGDAKQIRPYKNPNTYQKDPSTGKVTETEEKPNGFEFTVLHEMGHAVDRRWKITETYGPKASCGSWESYIAVSRVAQAVTTDFMGGSKHGGMTNDQVNAAVTATITGATVAKPDGVDEAGWKALQSVLSDCLAMRFNKNPWVHPKTFGGRVYIESGKGNWSSYDPKARESMHVTDYQWRAPGEWFAELYAFSWHKEEEPPHGVEENVRAYMYKKGGAATPSAP